MAFNRRVEDHHRLEMKSNFEVALQQLGSKLRPHVMEKPCTGEGAVAVDLIDAVSARRRTASPTPNPTNPAGRRRRWLVLQDALETGEHITSETKWREIETPDSELNMVHAAAVGRGVDEIILGIEGGEVTSGGILGAVVEGKRPGGAGKALPSKHITPETGTVGLTIAKLRGARKRLAIDENMLDRVTPIMGITPNQHDDLLGIVETSAGNLNQLEQPQIRDGRVTRLMGFEFVETNLLPKKDNIRSCPCWVKMHVVLGIWKDITPDMWNDSHMRNVPYIFVDASMDCTRRQDEGVHIVEAYEAPTT